MQHKKSWRTVDGVLFLDKPSGMTSNAALQTARRLFSAAKAGHTGTLDPMASGLLPLTLGEATKFSQTLLDADKVYEATVQLGVETDSGDADGATTETRSVSATLSDIEQTLECFRGEIEQVPPMYSALKRDGKPLYEYARAGIEVARAARKVCIHQLELLEHQAASHYFRIRVACSKGTYIRTLAVDIGRMLGCGAHLSALRRTGIGPFDIGRATALSVLQEMPEDGRFAVLSQVDVLLEDLPTVSLDALQAEAILQGRTVVLEPGEVGLVRLYGSPGRFLGVGERSEAGKLSAKRLIATGK